MMSSGQQSRFCRVIIFILIFYASLGCGGTGETGQLPIISSITTTKGKAAGPVTGGTAVTIRGRHFADDSSVRFGDREAAEVTIQNSSTLVATTAPVLQSGAVAVTIITGGQVVKKPSSFLFTPLITFTSNRDGDFEIYVMQIDGDGVKSLTDNSLRNPLDPTSLISDEFPRFSSEGGEILFDSNRTGNFDVFIMERDGTNPRSLTNNIATDLAATFSPDGGEIVFISNRLNFFNNPEGDFEIFLMDRNGGNLRQLTQNQADDRDPTFSPDGRQILFVSDKDGDFELFRIDRDGGNRIQLTQNQADDRDPTFSPDGRQILFVSDQDGDFELFLIDSDGTNLQKMTENNTEEFNPAFLPSHSQGKQVVFSSDRTGNLELFLMDCNGTDERFIVGCDETTLKNLTFHAAVDDDPSPSP